MSERAERRDIVLEASLALSTLALDGSVTGRGREVGVLMDLLDLLQVARRVHAVGGMICQLCSQVVRDEEAQEAQEASTLLGLLCALQGHSCQPPQPHEAPRVRRGPEQIGEFRLHPGQDLAGPVDGCTLSWRNVWLPVVAKDRDAALMLMALFLETGDEGPYLAVLEGYKADLLPVTVERILAYCTAWSGEER